MTELGLTKRQVRAVRFVKEKGRIGIGAGCIVLAGSGWYVRRWYIRRQNPALFREYD